ncbi:hypothetical protein PAXRUDRAFT_179592, partial [Paxillus rubicundulus Ve08.2h10]
IFLCTCVTGLSSHHVAKIFQCSPDTVMKYFEAMLFLFSSDPFYSSQVKFPSSATPISDHIICDPQFQFFDQCISTMDGAHIHMFIPAEQEFHVCNHKGFLLQNCLFICNFEFFHICILWVGQLYGRCSTVDRHMHN